MVAIKKAAQAESFDQRRRRKRPEHCRGINITQRRMPEGERQTTDDFEPKRFSDADGDLVGADDEVELRIMPMLVLRDASDVGISITSENTTWGARLQDDNGVFRVLKRDRFRHVWRFVVDKLQQVGFWTY